jgi:hypothetical protein
MSSGVFGIEVFRQRMERMNRIVGNGKFGRKTKDEEKQSVDDAAEYSGADARGWGDEA